MCDDITVADYEASLAKRGLSRRSFAAVSAAAVGGMAMSAACSAQTGAATLTETGVTIPTPDGLMDAVFVHPAESKHPAVIMYPDIAGVRDANKAMARVLAQAGYAVVLVNQYYRSAPAPVMATIAEFFAPDGRAKLAPMMAKLSNAGTMSDAKAIVAWLDQQPAVDAAKKIGAEGYCMTGSYAVRTASAVPDRIGAVSSFHGGGLVTDAPDSPHRLLDGTHALYLFAIAKNDDASSPTDKDELRQAAAAAGVTAHVEVFAGDHGWTVPDAPSYQKEEAERARALSLANYAQMG